MRLMAPGGIVPRSFTSRPHPGHKIDRYLVPRREVSSANQVSAAGITYLPMGHGSAYLVAIIDWYSPTVLAWRPAQP
jgi:putative transposase